MKTYIVDDSGVDECESGEWVKASVAQALYDALIQTRSIVCDGCEEGFNPLEGDWADQLFYNNAKITAALSLADGEE